MKSNTSTIVIIVLSLSALQMGGCVNWANITAAELSALPAIDFTTITSQELSSIPSQVSKETNLFVIFGSVQTC